MHFSNSSRSFAKTFWKSRFLLEKGLTSCGRDGMIKANFIMTLWIEARRLSVTGGRLPKAGHRCVKGKDAEARRLFGKPLRWLHGEEPCICHHAL